LIGLAPLEGHRITSEARHTKDAWAATLRFAPVPHL
jgi:hypothetical protein